MINFTDKPNSTKWLPLEIIYQDQYLVAINKPAGLLVHRSNIDRHETHFALQLLRDQLGQYVYPVHRLDKPTSGILVFALSEHVARALSRQFYEQTVSKKYLAVVRGYCPEEGIIDHPLKEERDKMTDRKQLRNKPPQQAMTYFRRLATVELPVKVDRYPTSRYSLAEVTPKSGRKHQIRRHMKHIAHPIIGDAKHGKGVHNRFFRTYLNSYRLLLSCVEFSFSHPITSERLSLHAPLTEDFKAVLLQLGWEDIL